MSFTQHQDIDPPALFRALADLAEQFQCSHPDLVVCDSDENEPTWAFGTGFYGLNAATSHVDTSFVLGVSAILLRTSLGAAYKRHSGRHAPWLLEPELAIVNWELEKLAKDDPSLDTP